MRILMVLGRSTGGIGQHVSRLTAELEAAGQTVEVVTDTSTASAFGWSHAHRLWPVHADLSAPRGLIEWHRIMKLAATVDVVHAHGHQAAVVAAVAVARARPRPGLVVSLHNELPPLGDTGRVAGRLAGRVAGSVVGWALRRAALVTGASEDLVRLGRRLGARRTELATVAAPAVEALLDLPPLTEQDRRAARAQLLSQLGSDPDRPLVLTVSRLAPQKDLPTLVAAAREASVPATWALLGGGDEALRASLESQLGGIPLLLVGPQRDVTRWLRAADVFVLTSRWEARALVVQEAMAAGLPVVVTRTGGLPGLVGEAGVLVPVGDSSAVAAAVDRLLREESERARLAAAARAVAATWEGPDDEARRWIVRYAGAAPSMT